MQQISGREWRNQVGIYNRREEEERREGGKERRKVVSISAMDNTMHHTEAKVGATVVCAFT